MRIYTQTTTHEVALKRAKQRTAEGTPTVVQSVYGGRYWSTRAVPFSCPWPSGKHGKPLVTREEAERRAKASTEAGRPQIVITARSGGYRVRDVALSSPVKKRYVNPNVLLSEEKVIEARLAYASGQASMREMARRFHVGKSTIQQAVHGQTWADVA